MSVSKIIKFYTFEPQPSMYNNGIYPISTLDLVKNPFLHAIHIGMSTKKKNIILISWKLVSIIFLVHVQNRVN